MFGDFQMPDLVVNFAKEKYHVIREHKLREHFEIHLEKLKGLRILGDNTIKNALAIVDDNKPPWLQSSSTFITLHELH